MPCHVDKDGSIEMTTSMRLTAKQTLGEKPLPPGLAGTIQAGRGGGDHNAMPCHEGKDRTTEMTTSMRFTAKQTVGA